MREAHCCSAIHYYIYIYVLLCYISYSCMPRKQKTQRETRLGSTLLMPQISNVCSWSTACIPPSQNALLGVFVSCQGVVHTSSQLHSVASGVLRFIASRCVARIIASYYIALCPECYEMDCFLLSCIYHRN